MQQRICDCQLRVGGCYCDLTEVWKEYPLDTRFKVSNLGNVIGVRGKLLSKCTVKTGYERISIYDNGKIKSRTVHQLVAETFLGYKRDGTTKYVVDHIDGNKSNNNLNNLRVVPHRENCKDRVGTSKYTGVYYESSRGKWKAQIVVDYKKIFLGRFDNEYDAHLAYENELKNTRTI